MTRLQRSSAVRCQYFSWKIFQRNGVYYADGRGKMNNAGRHSLGVKDRDDALRRLHQLDLAIAIRFGLAAPVATEPNLQPLTLDEGRARYEAHLKRPRTVGGVKRSTCKRYRAVFDKFFAFLKSKGVVRWQQVNRDLIIAYLTDLEVRDYKSKTLRNEVTTIIQSMRWLTDAGHLAGVEIPSIKLRRVESQKPYCYRPIEVEAMVAHCRATRGLAWLGDVVVALACTGFRISELASLRWSDVDLDAGILSLTDEAGATAKHERRELKTGRSRSLPINVDLRTVLERMARKDGLIFHGPRGGRLKPDSVRTALVRDVIRPLAGRFPSTGRRGFAEGRLHSLRHYFCSMCANQGVPEVIVMRWLGHRDSTMVRHYYTLHDEESRAQMDRLHLAHAGMRPPGDMNAAATESGGRPTVEEHVPKR